MLPRGLKKTRASCEVQLLHTSAPHWGYLTMALSSDVRSSMAAQMHALTCKLAESQRQLELQHQVQRECEIAASSAAAAVALVQRQWFVRVASAVSGTATAVSPLLSDAAELRATQQVAAVGRALLLLPCSAVTRFPAEAICSCRDRSGQDCTVV